MNMVTMRPPHSCPRCGCREFGVYESTGTAYLTNKDGEVCAYEDLGTTYHGTCLNCGKRFKMVHAYDTFIPMTPLQEFLIEFEPQNLAKTNNIDSKFIERPDNPMKVSK